MREARDKDRPVRVGSDIYKTVVLKTREVPSGSKERLGGVRYNHPIKSSYSIFNFESASFGRFVRVGWGPEDRNAQDG